MSGRNPSRKHGVAAAACRRAIRMALLAVTASTLAGCAIAPGMYMDLTSQDKNPPAAQHAAPQHVTVVPIDATTLRKMHDAQVAETASIYGKHAGSAAPYQYHIGREDVLRVTVWDHPELNNPVGTTVSTEVIGRPVDSQGYIYYPYIGRTKVLGKTVDEVRREMTKALAKYIVDPQLDVTIATFNSQKVYVSGEVKSPRVLPITDVPLHVADAIGKAGGVLAAADLGDATLTRGKIVHKLNLYDLYYRGDLSQNLLLKNGDVLNIPDRRYDKVFVLGEVRSPKSLIMPRGRLSLAEALSDQGGVSQVTSNPSQIYVIRDSESGKPVIYHLDGASPEAIVLADQFDLQPRDVVFVNPSEVTRWSRVISQLLPGAVTSAANTAAVAGQ
jgi:polysaccharide export outer membrane protein